MEEKNSFCLPKNIPLSPNYSIGHLFLDPEDCSAFWRRNGKGSSIFKNIGYFRGSVAILFLFQHTPVSLACWRKSSFWLKPTVSVNIVYRSRCSVNVLYTLSLLYILGAYCTFWGILCNVCVCVRTYRDVIVIVKSTHHGARNRVKLNSCPFPMVWTCRSLYSMYLCI